MRISTYAVLNKTTKISPVVFMPTINHSFTVGPRGRCLKIEVAFSLHFQLETKLMGKQNASIHGRFRGHASLMSPVPLVSCPCTMYMLMCFFVFFSFFVFFNVQDFWQMVIHHIVTTILLVLSYNTGFFRIGCVIILLHDVSDVFLEVSLDSVLNTELLIFCNVAISHN